MNSLEKKLKQIKIDNKNSLVLKNLLESAIKKDDENSIEIRERLAKKYIGKFIDIIGYEFQENLKKLKIEKTLQSNYSNADKIIKSRLDLLNYDIKLPRSEFEKDYTNKKIAHKKRLYYQKIERLKIDLNIINLLDEDYSNADKIIEKKLNLFQFKSPVDKKNVKDYYLNTKKDYEEKLYKQEIEELKIDLNIINLLDEDYSNADEIIEKKLNFFTFKSPVDKKNVKDYYLNTKKNYEEKLYRQNIEELKIDLNIMNLLDEDYLNADKTIKQKLDFFPFTSSNDKDKINKFYKNRKIKFIKQWIKENTKNKSGKEILLDDEQALAVGTIGTNCLVSARAGSGKTRVLISRAFFLIKHCNIPANEILILAFNTKAIEEISERLKELITGDLPLVQTFHALAHKIVKPEENMIYDYEDDKTHSSLIDELIKGFINDNKNIAKIKKVMLEDFKDDWEQLMESKYTKSPEEFLDYRRSLIYEAIDGKYIKSYGEKLIANFLFEHNIDYKYERNHTWNNLNYKPDFTIFPSKNGNNNNNGIIIEYFGMEGVKDYDITTKEKIKYWEKKEKWSLIEIYPKDINGNFDNFITSKLSKKGMTCKKLSEIEIWEKIKDPIIKNFTNVIKSFIGQCRKQEIGPSQLKKMIEQYKTNDEIELEFYSLCEEFYIKYLNILKEKEKEDFDGLLERSIKKIKENNSFFQGFIKNEDDKKKISGDLKHLKYIFIDEFQDFSKLFYSLITSIKKINDFVELFCVGDDWQAINGFAGSNLEFFKTFDSKFENTEKLSISKNYRSKIEIVDIGNKLQDGNGDKAIPNSSEMGKIKLVHVNNFKPTLIELQRHVGDYITPLVLRIITKNIKAGKKTMLISRRNSLPYYLYFSNTFKSNGLNKFLESIRSQIPEDKRHMVNINTAHKSKGLEEEVVILLDVTARSYPLIHPHWKYNKILGSSIEKTIEEERRLLYVALTRAKENLYIITNNSIKSPMLKEIENKKKIEKINFNDYQSIKTLDVKNKRIILRICNPEYDVDFYKEGTVPIKEILKKYKYQYNNKEYTWEKLYKLNDFNFNNILNQEWIKEAKNVNIYVINEENEKIIKWEIDKNGFAKEIYNSLKIHK